VKRVGIKDGFRMLLADRTRDEAVALLNEKRRNGTLRLYCNGKRHAGQYMEFKLDDKDEIAVFADVGVGGMRRADHIYNFKLDADQLAKLKPPPQPIPPPPTARRLLPRRSKPAPRLSPKKKQLGGRPQKLTAAELRAAERHRRDTGQPTTQRALAKHFNVSLSTIARLKRPKKKK
jgi:hypothetical protein